MQKKKTIFTRTGERTVLLLPKKIAISTRLSRRFCTRAVVMVLAVMASGLQAALQEHNFLENTIEKATRASSSSLKDALEHTLRNPCPSGAKDGDICSSPPGKMGAIYTCQGGDCKLDHETMSKFHPKRKNHSVPHQPCGTPNDCNDPSGVQMMGAHWECENSRCVKKSGALPPPPQPEKNCRPDHVAVDCGENAICPNGICVFSNM